MNEYIVIKSRWFRPHSTPELPINKECQIYGKLQDYHYGQMHDRLNEMPAKLRAVNNEFEGVGYLLRELWRKYEDRLVLHETKLKDGKHEQHIKERLKAFKIEAARIDGVPKEEKERYFEGLKMDAKSRQELEKYLEESKFSKDSGVYTDLVYDTFQKDWTKAYQYTFHEFFHNIDFLANSSNNDFFSQVYKKKSFPHYTAGCQFGKIIMDDISLYKRNDDKIDAVPKLLRHDKAPLCDILGGAIEKNRYADADGRTFGHGSAYWSEENEKFLKQLAIEVFAHMAATAAANQKAFNVMAEYLPDSYKMFVEILRKMLGIYVITHVR